jgi:hypothetical protein
MVQAKHRLESKVHQRECCRRRDRDVASARQLKEFQTALIFQRLAGDGAERGKT